jgi:serine kinase of HPr protein (carbohydrate metabolism regulator)
VHPDPILIHGTCVALGGTAAVLTGRPGSGKSDLALRFIHETPAELDPALVADDQVFVTERDGRLIARVPDTIAGRIEIRGVGIVPLPYRAEAEIRLFVDLVRREDVPRLPPEPLPSRILHNIAIPVIALAPFEASAALKLRFAILTMFSQNSSPEAIK